MFPADRQAQLDPIINEIKAIPGVVSVKQDDFDSVSIRLFIALDTDNSYGGSIGKDKPYRFKKPLRSISAQLAAVFRRQEVNAEILDRPRMTYYSNQGDKIRDGYSTSRFMIDLYV
jgi:hypothetical protein